MTGAPGRLRPDPRRKARFREIARGIVAKDRYNRKYGIAVDTAGAIAQALERAYRDGVRDDPAAAFQAPEQDDAGKSGRAACRERGGQDVLILVVAVFFKK